MFILSGKTGTNTSGVLNNVAVERLAAFMCSAVHDLRLRFHKVCWWCAFILVTCTGVHVMSCVYVCSSLYWLCDQGSQCTFEDESRFLASSKLWASQDFVVRSWRWSHFGRRCRYRWWGVWFALNISCWLVLMIYVNHSTCLLGILSRMKSISATMMPRISRILRLVSMRYTVFLRLAMMPIVWYASIKNRLPFSMVHLVCVRNKAITTHARSCWMNDAMHSLKCVIRGCAIVAQF